MLQGMHITSLLHSEKCVPVCHCTPELVKEDKALCLPLSHSSSVGYRKKKEHSIRFGLCVYILQQYYL